MAPPVIALSSGVAKPKQALPAYKWDSETVLEVNGQKVVRKVLTVKPGMVIRYPGIGGIAWKRDLGRKLVVDFYTDGRRVFR